MALFEGVVFEHRRHIQQLRAAGAVIDHATLSGGGSRSAVWGQMLADCLGLPISVADGDETGALGAALRAGVGVGLFPRYEEAVASMTRIRRDFAPNAAMAAHYEHRYRTSRELAEALQGFWSSQYRDAQHTIERKQEEAK